MGSWEWGVGGGEWGVGSGELRNIFIAFKYLSYNFLNHSNTFHQGAVRLLQPFHIALL
ncbi:MAG: hypothetical protein KME64_21955 [Scytonematopsis contorta HA4267-MV1]|nr:hypothetical protein [Scytonematopsis contorta HA4267-MV1]